MNISVKAEYALQAMFDLATRKPGEPVKIAHISKSQRIPQKFLELILAGLKQGGFVESRRGAEGGYLLAKASDSITVGQVIRYMEGARTEKGQTRHTSDGPFADLWRSVDRSISDVVDHTNFSDLVRHWRERQGTYVPNWDI